MGTAAGLEAYQIRLLIAAALFVGGFSHNFANRWGEIYRRKITFRARGFFRWRCNDGRAIAELQAVVCSRRR